MLASNPHSGLPGKLDGNQSGSRGKYFLKFFVANNPRSCRLRRTQPSSTQSESPYKIIMKKAPMTITALAITGFALMSALSAHGAFVISQSSTNGISGPAGAGQTFTTDVGISPVPSPTPSTIKLTSFSFWASGAGNTPSATTYLHIYDAKPAAATNLVGVSSNFIDTDPVLGLGTKMTWTFNNLELNYGTKYWAVFANGTTKITSQVVALGFQNSNQNPYSGGAALASNINENATQDARFEATFIPEPSTALGGVLCMFGLIRRRRA
jgi:hypothetical protein